MRRRERIVGCFLLTAQHKQPHSTRVSPMRSGFRARSATSLMVQGGAPANFRGSIG
jgi:hypothetical protein